MAASLRAPPCRFLQRGQYISTLNSLLHSLALMRHFFTEFRTDNKIRVFGLTTLFHILWHVFQYIFFIQETNKLGIDMKCIPRRKLFFWKVS